MAASLIAKLAAGTGSTKQVWSFIDGKDPLIHQAAFTGDISALCELLKEHKHLRMINFKNRLGCTPLRLAATAGSQDCIKMLLQHGAEIEAIDIKAQTPLYVAVRNKHLDSVKVLLAAGAHPDGNRLTLCTPLFFTVYHREAKILKTLIRYGANMNTSQAEPGALSTTPLFISLSHGFLDCFLILLQAGADPDYLLKSQPSGTEIFPRKVLYEVVVRLNANVKFAQHLYEFGADLYLKNDRDASPHEVACRSEFKRNSCAIYVKSLCECPRSLQCLCRISIRQHFIALAKHQGKTSYQSLQGLKLLPLPTRLKLYLRHKL